MRRQAKAAFEKTQTRIKERADKNEAQVRDTHSCNAFPTRRHTAYRGRKINGRSLLRRTLEACKHFHGWS